MYSYRKHAYLNILKFLHSLPSLPPPPPPHTHKHTPPKKEKQKFSDKNSDIFHIPAQNVDCWYALEPPREAVLTNTHNLCFFSKIRQIMFIPINSSFTIYKWCLRGSKLYRRVFVMVVTKFWTRWRSETMVIETRLKNYDVSHYRHATAVRH